MIGLPESFEQAVPVLETLIKNGYEAYFVGGSVRDLQLNQPISDVDIATSAFPEEVKLLFKKTFDVGIEHGTVVVVFQQENYEITTFRTESTYQDFRRPDEVTFVRSLEEDLKRRDFTINALAMTLDGEIIDLFNGLKDLERRLIRAVGVPAERFHEDALRMMRGVRFASQLDFEMEEGTQAAMLEHHALLKHIAIERIQVEFVKLMLGKGRSKGLEKLVETKLFKYCPGLAEGEEALRAFAQTPQKINHHITAWVLLAHFLGLEVEEVPTFLKAWKCSNKDSSEVKLALSLVELYFEKGEWTKEMLYQAGATIIPFVEETLRFLERGNNLAEVLAAYHSLPIHSLKDLAVTGNDLIQMSGRKAGAWLGQCLAAMEQQVLVGSLPNQKAILLKWAKEYLAKTSV